MRVYIASNYTRREEMQGYASQLREMGYTVNVRWITGEHENMENETIALEDRQDLYESDVCLNFTKDAENARRRGGRHVEMGMAIALEIHCVIIGPRENVFHWLPEVTQFDTWEEARVYLAGYFGSIGS
jgi:hypothetical protein